MVRQAVSRLSCHGAGGTGGDGPVGPPLAAREPESDGPAGPDPYTRG